MYRKDKFTTLKKKTDNKTTVSSGTKKKRTIGTAKAVEIGTYKL